jgi:hypothetical protein
MLHCHSSDTHITTAAGEQSEPSYDLPGHIARIVADNATRELSHFEKRSDLLEGEVPDIGRHVSTDNLHLQGRAR